MGAHGEFAYTEKQAEIMRHVFARVDEGAYITLAELRDKLSYKPSKQAVLCSIGFLEKHGFLTKKLHGNRTMDIIPTAKAYAMLKPTPETV